MANQVFEKLQVEDIKQRFINHPPKNKEINDNLDSLTKHLIALGVYLTELLPDGREKALAITKLEECSMWSKAAIARNQ